MQQFIKNRKQLRVLISKREEFTHLLRTTCFKELKSEMRINQTEAWMDNRSETAKLRQLHSKICGLFQVNTTIKGVKVKISLKPELKPIRQKVRPLSVYSQKAIIGEIKKLEQHGHMKNLENAPENTFMLPEVIAVKEDKSVKFALNSR